MTVRGTVGIKRPHGIPVITAGTGPLRSPRVYLDSVSREEYLDKLANLHSYPRLTPEQIELAERYAFLIFCCQPFELSSVSLEYNRDALATPRMSVHCRTRQQWLDSPDMRRLSAWIADPAFLSSHLPDSSHGPLRAGGRTTLLERRDVP